MAMLPTNDEEYTLETTNALPAHFLMKIESFSLLLEREVDKCESKEFEAGDKKWRLIIHPDGPIKSKLDDAENHISVYVAIVENNSMPTGWEKTQWGFSKLVSLGCLRDPKYGFIVDDNCVFGAEVAVIKTQRVTERVSLLKAGGPFKSAWNISDFSKLKRIWYSEEFIAGDHKWKVKLYPDGNRDQKGNSVSMYLECVRAKSFASHEKVEAEFSLSIKNQLSINHHSESTIHQFSSSENDWGFTSFIPLSDMRDPKKGFVVDDCCIVEVEICAGATKHDDN